MSMIKHVVPMMSSNIWRILEKVGVPMRSFALNIRPEQYSWTLPAIDEGATEKELAQAP